MNNRIFFSTLVCFFCATFSAFSQNRVELSVGNRWAANGVFFAEIWATMPISTNSWSVNASNIVISYNTAALNPASFNNQNAYLPDSEISGTNGYDVMTQTAAGAGRVSLNIVKFGGSLITKSNTFRIGVLRWAIINLSLTDNLSFAPSILQVFHNSTLLSENGGTNGFGITNPAQKVIGVPEILQNPSPQVVCIGQSAMFSVQATGSNLTYQWYKDNIVISGAQSPIYTISSTATNDIGMYKVVVESACCSTSSGVAGLTLNTGASFTANPQNITVCEGNSAQFTVQFNTLNIPPITWQVSNDAGSTWQNIAGQSTATLTLNALTLSMSGFRYRATAPVSCGANTTAEALLTVNSSPLIVSQSTGASVAQGGSATLSVSASGTANSYQWQRYTFGVYSNIFGATSATYSIQVAQAEDAGNYRVQITSPCGTTNSNLMVLNVQVVQGNRIVFSIPTTRVSNGVLYAELWANVLSGTTWAVNASNIVVGYNANALNAFPYNNQAIAEPNFEISNNNGYGEMTQTAAGSGRVSLNIVKAGGTLVTKSGYFKVGTFRWAIIDPTLYSNLQFSTTLTQVFHYDTQLVFNTNTAVGYGIANPTSYVVGAPKIIQQPSSLGACVGFPVSFSVIAEGENVSYQWKKGTATIFGATSATYTILSPQMSDAGDYFCDVQTTCCTVTSQTVSLTVYNASAPQITVQPTTIITGINTTATFFVMASGGQLTYQWQRRNSQGIYTNISGANSDTLRIYNIQPSDSGYFRVVISSPCVTTALISNEVSLSISQNVFCTIKAYFQGFYQNNRQVKTPASIELRSGGTTPIQSVFITEQAVNFSTTGTASVAFVNLAEGSYWIIVRHGGHLPVCSATKIVFSPSSPTTYDFTLSASSAYLGTSNSLVQSGSIFLVRSGDLDGNQTVNSADALNYFMPNNGRSVNGLIPAP